MGGNPVNVVSYLLHKNLIFAAGDLFSAIGDVQRGVLGVQLARVHPALVGRSPNDYVSPVVSLTTYYCLVRAISIAGFR